jgi:hypothetical protein
VDKGGGVLCRCIAGKQLGLASVGYPERRGHVLFELKQDALPTSETALMFPPLSGITTHIA